MSAAVSRQLISFGPFEFDPTSGLLFEGDQETLLPPKAAGVLRVLLESSGELVTKDELLESAWEGSFVAEGTLTDTVSALRRELNDDPLKDRAHAHSCSALAPYRRLECAT